MPPAQWPAVPNTQPYRRSLPVVVALAAVTAITALGLAIMTLTRPPGPSYTAAQRSAAQTYLCERFKLAALAVHIATNNPDNDAGVARNSLTNGALILEAAAEDPAIDTPYRDSARALATAYQTQAAMGNTATVDQYHVAMEDTTTKTYAMQGICGA